MKIANQEVWQSWVKANTDPYGRGILSYAERWADLMEAHLANGEKFEDFGKWSQTSITEEIIND